jgi:hypothetical protein
MIPLPLAFPHVGSSSCMIDFGLSSPDDGFEKLYAAVGEQGNLGVRNVACRKSDAYSLILFASPCRHLVVLCEMTGSR